MKEYIGIVFSMLFIGIFIYSYYGNKDYLINYITIFKILFFFCLFIKDLKSFSIVRDYIRENEQAINKKYQLDVGIGYNNFFRNFTEPEISILLNSKVKDNFIVCYKFPIKILMIFLITIYYLY